VITGADGHRLHEEVISAGGTIRNGRFARLNVGETQAALEAGTDESAPGFICDELAGLWPQIEGPLYRALEVRAEDVTVSLERKLSQRAEEEESNIRAVLTDLQRSITHQLEELESTQGLQLFLSGFEPSDLAITEREQLERDIDSLRKRLSEIPDEIEREVDAIRRRYANPSHRLFPAAVTFIVPEAYIRRRQ